MTIFRAADWANPLMQGLPTWYPDSEIDWAASRIPLAIHGTTATCNAALPAALVATEISLTHGPKGLVPKSTAYLDRAQGTSDAERDLRNAIDWWTESRSGRSFDATGTRTRREFEREMDKLAKMHGECYAIRVPGIGGRLSSWRLVTYDRICNPSGRADSEITRQGWQFSDGELVGIHVRMGSATLWADPSKARWTYVPLRAEDGTPNVAIRFGQRMPGCPRGITIIAQTLGMLATLDRLTVAETVGRLRQAVMPIAHMVDDPVAAAAAAPKIDPLLSLYYKHGEEIKFLTPNWNGAELNEFMSGKERMICATRGLPHAVVAAQMADSNLASARAGLDQADRTAEGLQDDHVEQASSVFNEAEVREAQILGIIPSEIPVSQLTFRHVRPRKYSVDALKDAKTIGELIASGASSTEAMGRVGIDWVETQEQKAAEAEYLARQREKLGLDAPAEDGETEAETAGEATP